MNEAPSTAVPKDEWKRRFAARIMLRADWPEVPAMQCAEAAVAEYDDFQEDFQSDPEAAADEEMSCWSDGGDE